MYRIQYIGYSIKDVVHRICANLSVGRFMVVSPVREPVGRRHFIRGLYQTQPRASMNEYRAWGGVGSGSGSHPGVGNECSTHPRVLLRDLFHHPLHVLLRHEAPVLWTANAQPWSEHATCATRARSRKRNEIAHATHTRGRRGGECGAHSNKILQQPH